LHEFDGDAKNVNATLKAKTKAWTFEAKVKAIKFGLALMTTSL